MEGKVLEEVVLVEGVEDQVGAHNLVEVGLEARAPLVADQTDQGREQEEVACHHGLEAQQEEGEGPVQVVAVPEGQGDRVDQEEDEGDPA